LEFGSELQSRPSLWRRRERGQNKRIERERERAGLLVEEKEERVR
jgi:hypothetical protein